MLTDQIKSELRQQLAELWGCDPDELRGQELGDALRDAEHSAGNVWVAWACWSDSELREAL